MKITVTSFYLPPTDRIGAGVQMHSLANAYADLGFEVSLVSPQETKEAGSKYSLQYIPISGTNRVVKWAIALARLRYDNGLVHFGGDNHFVSKSRHSVHMRTFLGSCFAEMKVATNARDKIRMTYLGVTELLGQANVDMSTVISADTNKYFLKPNHIIPCGIDLSRFRPGSKKATNPTILFVGMIDSRKRGRLLVDAFNSVVRSHFPTAELWIVRDSQVVNSPGVRVFGSVSQEELIRLYQESWCFCLPSVYEGFGVPYIESMACGTAVVCTPNSGAIEVLENGRYGLMASPDDLGETLIRLLGDENLRTSLVSQGLEYVRKFDIRTVARQYIELAKSTGKL
jgi:glycosyltransferase involved in cell wall biosynthesis